jgi:3-hydroxyisobutyrate dehydrogenase-like beta-hydroxyacid dehydrogenase
MRSVAVIGAGSMGAAIARHLLRAGHAVTVCDLDDAALQRLSSAGARTTRRAADCAAADVVLVLVATSEQALAVLLGEDGLHAGPAEDHAPTVVVMSTVPPDTMVRLQDGLRSRVRALVDAPVSGGPSRAEQGMLTVMAGGDAAVIEDIRSVLQTFASTIVRCGPLGAGQAMKIVNNIVGNANLVVTAEAYRMATELGLTIEDTARALDAGTGRNFFSAQPGDLPALYAAMARDRAGFTSLLAIVRKDIGAAQRMASRWPGRYPAVSALERVIDGLGDETYDNWRFIAAQGAG